MRMFLPFTTPIPQDTVVFPDSVFPSSFFFLVDGLPAFVTQNVFDSSDIKLAIPGLHSVDDLGVAFHWLAVDKNSNRSEFNCMTHCFLLIKVFDCHEKG